MLLVTRSANIHTHANGRLNKHLMYMKNLERQHYLNAGLSGEDAGGCKVRNTMGIVCAVARRPCKS